MLLEESLELVFDAFCLSLDAVNVLDPRQLVLLEEGFQLGMLELETGKVSCLALRQVARLSLPIIGIVSEHLPDVGNFVVHALQPAVNIRFELVVASQLLLSAQDLLRWQLVSAKQQLFVMNLSFIDDGGTECLFLGLLCHNIPLIKL